MNIQLIQVPYDSGHKSKRTGRGPDHFLQCGADQVLREAGHQVDVSRLEAQDSFTTEVGTAFELNRLLAEQVRSARSNNRLPIVLAGNCISCLGTIAGIDQNSPGIIWLDAHGDFNTPDSTVSGFLDGMGLAMATGRGWRSLLRTIPGFAPLPESNVIHIGARDLDPEEELMLQRSEVQVISPAEERNDVLNTIDAAFTRIKEKVTGVYLHIDLDVLDTGEALPNHLAVPGGFPVDVVEAIIGMTKAKFEVCAGAITSFDPAYDKEDQVLDAGIRIMKAFAA